MPVQYCTARSTYYSVHTDGSVGGEQKRDSCACTAAPCAEPEKVSVPLLERDGGGVRVGSYRVRVLSPYKIFPVNFLGSLSQRP